MSDSTDSGTVSIRQASEAAPSVLTEAERHKILVEWNRTERDYPRDKCVHQLFEEQVERTPDAVAVVFEKDSLTYRELNLRANRLANHLRGLGVGPETLVALCLERSLEMIVAILGTLKAGAAYVPIDPDYPADRVAFMLADANAPVILTQEALREKLPPTPAKVICLDSGWEIIERESEAAPASGVTADNLAYVIYTSGSTGRPKGAMNTHRGVVNQLLWAQDEFRLTAHDALLQKAPFSFDISVWEFFCPLQAGARLVIARPDGHRDSQYLIRLTISRQITMLQFVPSMLRHFLQEAEVGNCSSLRRVICGGEALPWNLQEAFFERLPGVALHNLYGPTEAAVYATHWNCTQNNGLRAVPIGRPIANNQIYILDESRRPVPAGVAGELHVGGVGVARGYHNRPDLTAEKFIANPFGVQPDARLYRTSDLARWLPDGNIEFLGRMDQQVKIRGFRIELGEIESVLCQHPALSAGAVTAQPDGVNEMELAAFVVARDAPALSVASLRQWLAEKLPDYMIPARFVAVAALPLNVNGKLDRKALAKLDGAELAPGTDYAAPRNELERTLVEIWQTVFRRERVGIRDNFFELGGHSLLAALIGSRINRQLGIDVPLRQILEHPTIETLAGQMASSEGHQQNLRPIEKADRAKPLPMSFGQQGMWLLQQTLPDPATYNEPVAWRLSGRVDREKVRRALQIIMERHEVLRTALVMMEGNMAQQVAGAKEIPLPWREMNLRAVPAEKKEAALEEQLLAEARRPFDLAQAPLWRAVWIELAAEEQVLAFTFHHSIIDEWSLRLFFKELEQLYVRDGLAELPALPVQYADYAAWQRQRLTGERLETLRNYWREQLQDLPPVLELPTDKPRTLQPSGRGATHGFRLTGPVVSGLRELAREEGTTLFTVMLAAFQVWLHRYTGQTDLIVGTPAASRERPEVQSLMGLFLNTLPIRTRLESGHNFREIVRQVRETLLGAFSHADLPFEQMVEMAVKEREAGQHLLFQVMFVLLEEGLPPLRLDQTQSRLVPMETKASKRDLTLNIQAAGEAWDCQLEYATDLFSAEGAARMAQDLTELFRTIAEDSRAPVSQLQLMPEAERHQILVEWNRTERDYPRDKCIHQLFEEQVERTPDAVAVVFEKDSLTYRELNKRAKQLTHHLLSLGVKPGNFVGLRVERSLEMVVALLGILKAGGAYWALEENLPEERFRLMLANARPRVLLVRRSSFKHLSRLVEKAQIDLPNGTITITAIEDLLESSPEETVFDAPRNQAGDPAYVSHTSGSTGQPKGVVVPHRGVVRLVKGTDYVSLNAEETLLHLSPLSFDASTFEIWGALLNGGRVVLLPPGPPTLAEIGGAIRRHGVTTLWLTAGLFHLMVDERLDDLKPLRQLLAGGDVLSPERVRKAFRALPGCRIINGYGPTENTTFTCCHAVVDELELAPSVPIGRPIANTRVYVLDSHLQPVPVGVAGELYAGGDGVACGYLRQPQLTAERFIPDPFSGKSDARLYRTGDLARWRPDGNLEFLGRLDTQVKIRGFRIELGEVEAALRAQPEVREATVIVLEDMPDDKRLAAYLVAKTVEKPDASTMRARLARTLPDYMIPNCFAWLDQLPLTANGKVDRKALPAPETSGGSKPDLKSQPINMLKLELIRIWRRLFQREDIGRRDNFFALGGHSLMAARLAAEIDRMLGRKLPIATLFQSPTIESLARRLTDENWAPAWSSLVPLQPQGSKPPLFLVHGWGGDVFGFLDLAKLLPPDQPTYGIQAVGLDGKSPRHISIEEMAAHYVKEIISFQPGGPLYLAGFSMGGMIAYEIARQLRGRGRQVALLALMDSAPTGKTPCFFYGLAMAAYIPGRCWFHFRQWLNLPVCERLNYIRRRWAALRYWMVRNHSRPPLVTAPPQQPIEQLQASLGTDYYRAVAHSYQLRPYPGAVDIFVGDEANPGWRWYWRYLARDGVSFHRISGKHLQILISTDYMQELAKSLTTALHRAQEKERAAPPGN